RLPGFIWSTTMAPGYPRYAVYYAPAPGSRWWNFGCRWLGRDPISGNSLASLRLNGFTPAAIATLTALPRRYGFHATLKAPFALAPDATVADLERTLAEFAGRRSP